MAMRHRCAPSVWVSCLTEFAAASLRRQAHVPASPAEDTVVRFSADGSRRARFLARHMDRDVGGRRRDEHDLPRAARCGRRRTIRGGAARTVVGDERLGARPVTAIVATDLGRLERELLALRRVAHGRRHDLRHAGAGRRGSARTSGWCSATCRSDAFHWRWESSPDGSTWVERWAIDYRRASA